MFTGNCRATKIAAVGRAMGQRGNQLRFAGILFPNNNKCALSGGSGVGHGGMGSFSTDSHCRSRRGRQETSLPVGKPQEVWGQCRDVGRSHLQQQQNAGETCR